MDRSEAGDDECLASMIESVLLVADLPLSIRRLARLLETDERTVRLGLERVRARLGGHGIRLQEHEDKLQLVTAPENAEIVQRYLGLSRKSRLSRPAMETLAMVAYRQPVTRAEIEQLRGVNSDRVITTLESKGLIVERGRREGPGRPIEYGTTFAFLEFFGLTSLEELPSLPETDTAPVEAGTLGLRGGAGH